MLTSGRNQVEKNTATDQSTYFAVCIRFGIPVPNKSFEDIVFPQHYEHN